MARETKVGLVLVVVLACGFGLLLYKRLQHPQITVAQATEGNGTEISADDIKAEIQLASKTDTSSPSGTANNPAATLPSSLENELLDLKNDPATSPVATTKTPSKNLPALPTDLDDMAFPADAPQPAVAASTTKPATVDDDPFADIEIPAAKPAVPNRPEVAMAMPPATASQGTSKTVELDPFANDLAGSNPEKTSSTNQSSSNNNGLTVSSGNQEPARDASIPSGNNAGRISTSEDPFAMESIAAPSEKQPGLSVETANPSVGRTVSPATNKPTVAQDDPFSMPVEIPATDTSLVTDSQAKVVESLELPVQVEPKRPAANLPAENMPQPDHRVVTEPAPELGFAELDRVPAAAKTQPPAAIDEFQFESPQTKSEPAKPALPLDVDSDPFAGGAMESATRPAEKPISTAPSLPVNSRPSTDLDALGFETQPTPTSGLNQPAPISLPIADPLSENRSQPMAGNRTMPVNSDLNSVGATDRTAANVVMNRYTVEPNDNFWSISRKVYGSGRYFNALASHNAKAVPRPETMKPGSTIEIPPVEFLEQKYGFSTTREVAGSSMEHAQPDEKIEMPSSGFFIDRAGVPMYKVSEQDTMSGIARAHLGRSSRWIQILELNRDKLQDGNTIAVGTILRLPPDASQVQVMNTPAGSRN